MMSRNNSEDGTGFIGSPVLHHIAPRHHVTLVGVRLDKAECEWNVESLAIDWIPAFGCQHLPPKASVVQLRYPGTLRKGL